jgi:hypothetical protein
VRTLGEAAAAARAFGDPALRQGIDLLQLPAGVT